MADDPSTFSKLSDDVVLKIFFQLEDDPRNWARLSCVCRKFSSLISTVCCKSKCLSAFPAISAELLSLSASSSASSPPGEWAALHKLAVCCPGLLHAGVLLDNSDFGLYRELGPDTDFKPTRYDAVPPSSSPTQIQNPDEPGDFGVWSLYDDLYFDTIYNNSELQDDDSSVPAPMDAVANTPISESGFIVDPKMVVTTRNYDGGPAQCKKKRKVARRAHRGHLASGAWNLSREQGNKLLASRFRGDCLYICDWPGCVHMEEKRNYMLFRGFFKNFKRSRVWRTINDGNRSRTDLNCTFCGCKETWDLHSAFCLKRGFGFHDDGEPVVRAYVCENGHVSGAWTDQPLYT